jgi:hypothetical protein
MVDRRDRQTVTQTILRESATRQMYEEFARAEIEQRHVIRDLPDGILPWPARLQRASKPESFSTRRHRRTSASVSSL